MRGGRFELLRQKIYTNLQRFCQHFDWEHCRHRWCHLRHVKRRFTLPLEPRISIHSKTLTTLYSTRSKLSLNVVSQYNCHKRSCFHLVLPILYLVILSWHLVNGKKLYVYTCIFVNVSKGESMQNSNEAGCKLGRRQ